MRKRQGATLSLVVAVTFVIIVLGVGFFFLAKIIGGARELQNAVDSGNLNVAKSSLRTPVVRAFGPGPSDLSAAKQQAVIDNFSQLRDAATGEIDLLVYNRLIGQTMLVAMNAASDNYGFGPPNPDGIANSKMLIDLLSNPDDGVGAVLANKLSSDAAMDDSFAKLANLMPMRMLNINTSNAAPVVSGKEIAFMVPQTATNLIFVSGQIPDEFNAISPTFASDNTVKKGSNTYLKGYELIDIPTVTDASTYPLMGVPLRPMEKPHLVTLNDFRALKTSPLPGVSSQPAKSRVPPNAFKSEGITPELKSARALQLLSCAIAGCVNVNGEFPASIPCGFIVVANGDGLTPSNVAGSVTTDKNAPGLSANDYGGGNKDIFSDVLMSNTVFIAANGAMAQNAQAIVDIQQWKQDQMQQGKPTSPVPDALANALDGPTPKQQYADGIDANETPVPCTNYNSVPGESGSNKRCVDNLVSMANVYNTSVPGQSGGNSITGLMSIEKEKADVINPRPGGGPAEVKNMNNVCTGMKSFRLDGKIPPSDPIQFGKAPTIKNLLASFEQYQSSASNASLIERQLVNKLMQIRPKSNSQDIDKVLSAAVPMGSVMYIWLDDNGQFQVTDQSALPSWIKPNNIKPDGTSITADTGSLVISDVGDRRFVNLENEQNFPSPWDCPGGPATTRSTAKWTRSSGFNCLQGVLRFMNCTTDGGQAWRCPC
jgi:hypothetical protein